MKISFKRLLPDSPGSAPSVFFFALTALAMMALLAVPFVARSHEFWIEAESFVVPVRNDIIATLKNGENFAGGRFPYVPDRFARFDISDADGSRPVVSRLGDDPAVRQPALASGLNIIAYVSSGTSVNHETFGKFERFLEEEGLMWASAIHRERQLPTENIVEFFTRYAKALIMVDSPEAGAGSGDHSQQPTQPLGLEMELLALVNPYNLHVANAMDMKIPIQVLYQGEPLVGTQLSIFHRTHQNEVTVHRLSVDEHGTTLVDVSKPGNYLLNAVHLRQPDVATMLQTGAVWESLWASLTFSRPMD